MFYLVFTHHGQFIFSHVSVRHEAAPDDADEDVQSREQVCKDQDTRDLQTCTLDRGVLALTFSQLVMDMMMMTLRVDDLM